MRQIEPDDKQRVDIFGGRSVSIRTQDGRMETAVFAPAGEGPYPLAIIYMDAFGLRPALYEIARRLADDGYYTLLPHLFYRAGRMPALDPATAFANPDSRALVMGLINSLSKAQAMADTMCLIEWAASQSAADPSRIGTVGYCMGGGLALTAAADFKQVRAAAAFHAGRLVSDAPDSPHLRAKEIQARVYIGAADEDASFTAADGDALREAFEAAGTDYQLEFYTGARHGFAMQDLSVYDAQAYKRHLRCLLDLFCRSLQASHS